MQVPREERAAVDLAPLLHSAMTALGAWDADALERLLEKAETLRSNFSKQVFVSKDTASRLAFEELLGSTLRNLSTLQRLYGPGEDTWVR